MESPWTVLRQHIRNICSGAVNLVNGYFYLCFVYRFLDAPKLLLVIQWRKRVDDILLFSFVGRTGEHETKFVTDFIVVKHVDLILEFLDKRLLQYLHLTYEQGLLLQIQDNGVYPPVYNLLNNVYQGGGISGAKRCANYFLKLFFEFRFRCQFSF